MQQILTEQAWLVWSPSGNPPQYQHESEESAWKEADRLARLHPGEQFFVLHAKDCVMMPKVKLNRMSLPLFDLPF